MRLAPKTAKNLEGMKKQALVAFRSAVGYELDEAGREVE